MSKPDATETERRRKHVEHAVASSRIEGQPPPSRPEQAILDAYIRGEIEAKDLVTVYKRRKMETSEGNPTER